MHPAIWRRFPGVALCLLLLFAGCSRHEPPPTEAPAKTTLTLHMTSSAFAEGAPIPTRYTCDGPDLSPPLAWSGVPSGAKSLALVCDDPDAPAGTWTHWVLYGLPPTTTELPEGLPATETLAGGGRQGTNDFHRTGYGGPCPPPGKPHRYYFRLYALDMQPSLPPGATKRDLETAMKGHVLAEGALMGTYRKP